MNNYLFFKNKGYFELNPVLSDFAIFTNTDILVLNLGGLHISQDFGSTFAPLLDSIIEAFG